MTVDHTPVAIITGASRGLGLALARHLAQQGWSLILTARGQDDLQSAAAELSPSTDVEAIAGDLQDASHRALVVQAAQRRGGALALINNAGVLGPSPQPMLRDYPLEALEQVYRINTLAPLALIQDLQEVLAPQARILNLSSDAAQQAYPGWGGYGSAKAALEQWTAVLAQENPDWRVYAVDPGDMRTRMHQRAFPGEDISDRPLPETSVPGLWTLLQGTLPSGRYQARAL